MVFFWLWLDMTWLDFQILPVEKWTCNSIICYCENEVIWNKKYISVLVSNNLWYCTSCENAGIWLTARQHLTMSPTSIIMLPSPHFCFKIANIIAKVLQENMPLIFLIVDVFGSLNMELGAVYSSESAGVSAFSFRCIVKGLARLWLLQNWMLKKYIVLDSCIQIYKLINISGRYIMYAT